MCERHNTPPMTRHEQTLALLRAANLLRLLGDDALAALVLRSMALVGDEPDPDPLAHERDVSRDAGGLP